MWVTPEQIERAKKIDLLTYLQEHEPGNLRRIGSSTYCAVEHDSLKISNGMWHWFSRHIGGKNALDYLMKVRGFSFPEAVAHLSDDGYCVIQPVRADHSKEPHELEMPKEFLYPEHFCKLNGEIRALRYDPGSKRIKTKRP